jgi:hypothetical protein
MIDFKINVELIFPAESINDAKEKLKKIRMDIIDFTDCVDIKISENERLFSEEDIQ